MSSNGPSSSHKLSNRAPRCNGLKPRMDLHEDTKHNKVTATFEFPGVSKESIQIDLDNGQLIVSAETEEPEEHVEWECTVRERRFGKYSRTLQVSQRIKADEVKASLADGVLTVTFPKSTPDPPKRIRIF